MINVYRGEVPLVLDGKSVIVKFDYDSLAILGRRYGDLAADRLQKSTGNLDTSTLLNGLVIGLERHQPGIYSVDKIKAMVPMPPLDKLQEVVFEALMASHYGAAGPPQENPIKRLMIWFKVWWIELFGRKKQHLQQG